FLAVLCLRLYSLNINPSVPLFCSFFFSRLPPPPRSPLFPYTTLFRSHDAGRLRGSPVRGVPSRSPSRRRSGRPRCGVAGVGKELDRKSTRLNSSHVSISYAVFCLKKKKKKTKIDIMKRVM